MNEHGSQGQSTVGSELLLGMHGFVGGQSQNSGRAPGLQMQLSVSRGWRRIEVRVKTTEAHRVRSPLRRETISRRCGRIGKRLGQWAGSDSAGGSYSQDVSYWRRKDDERRSGKPLA